jgi:hypothetical protein
MSGDKLKFLDYRKPKLESGKYKVEVTQQYGNPKRTEVVSTATSALTFRVTGDQLRLSPEQVFAQYPPAGEAGDFADTLPHIALNKASLPWERSAYVYDDDAVYSELNDVEIYEPWLYLMVINDDDISRGDVNNPETRKLGDMIDDATQGTGSAYLPQPFVNRLKKNVEDQILQASEEVLTIDVKASFFRDLIADRKEDLQYLAHVRQRYSESDELIRELAVIMANRFAQGNNQKYPLGMANYAMLVSLEQYLNDDSRVSDDTKSLYVTGGQTTGTPLDQLSGDADAYVRLVILTRWSFTSKDSPINFEKRSQALDVGSLRLPSKDSSPDHPYLTNIPKRDNGTPIDDRLKAGMTALWHKFRLGDQSLSWYRGPFVPYQITEKMGDQLSDYERGKEGENTYVATDADRLLRCYRPDGVFDVSHAAAYELGRFLALRNADYAKALYQYKRARARYVTLNRSDIDRKERVTSKGILIEELPYAKLNPAQQADYLAVVTQYLVELASLKDVPVWYLIPDSRLVPQRTIRTFTIDMKWMQSLWLGALSLASRPEITYLIYEELFTELQARVPSGGFLLHSDLVWAYPELVIEAKQISETADGSDDGTLDIGKLRADHAAEYTDYIERQLPEGRQQVRPRGLLEQREITMSCQLVFTTDYVVGQCVKHNDSYFECLQSHRADSRFDLDYWDQCQDWVPHQQCFVGQFVIYEGQAYQCITPHTSSIFLGTMWEISDNYWQAQIDYQINACVRYGDTFYLCTEAHTSAHTFGCHRWRACPEWQAQTSYTQSQLVTYKDVTDGTTQVYLCAEDHTSEEGLQPNSATQWQVIDTLDWEASDNKSFNYLALSLPPEALHYGMDATAVEVNGHTQYSYEKAIKYNGQTVCTVSSDDIQVDERGVVNIEHLAQAIKQGLQDSSAVDDTYKNGLTDSGFGSARLSRYMLEGEPKVEFSLGGTK